MPLKIKKQIYDNVHGYIGLTDTELRIIDTPVFQRLRHIKQLGPVYLVYPGATHTRFSHSIGTMFMMDLFLKNAVKSEVSEDDTQKLRLAALLHDIGHYPFSHTLERYIESNLDGASHEDFGTAIIRDMLSDKLENFNAEEITRIISGKGKKEFGMLLSSTLDADKSDYLLRDSYNTGVPYGRIGIMSMLRIINFEKDRIVFEKDESPIENFIIGRYHLYKALVYHKTVVGFDVLLQTVFGFLVEEGYIADPNSLSTEEEILRYTDDTVMVAMHEYLSKGASEQRKKMVMMFLARKPPRLVYSLTRLGPGGRIPKEIATVERMVYDKTFKEEFAEKSGADPESVLPSVMNELKFLEDSTNIYIRKKDGTVPLEKGNSIILNMLMGKTVYDARIYCAGNSLNRMTEAFLKMV